jgi:hypothetical protein
MSDSWTERLAEIRHDHLLEWRRGQQWQLVEELLSIVEDAADDARTRAEAQTCSDDRREKEAER